ncbi:hypothetical protein [Kitasatospora cheerisanensis]|uniref:hypothetical protein n=1 Tax=Kitasatospora cheerisanensis TaxID=81942 RepID=UPI003CC53ED8
MTSTDSPASTRPARYAPRATSPLRTSATASTALAYAGTCEAMPWCTTASSA